MSATPAAEIERDAKSGPLEDTSSSKLPPIVTPPMPFARPRGPALEIVCGTTTEPPPVAMVGQRLHASPEMFRYAAATATPRTMPWTVPALVLLGLGLLGYAVGTIDFTALANALH